MRFLLDADVLSESTKPAPNERVVTWLLINETQLAVNPIVLGEVEYGILALPASKRREKLEKWFADVVRRIRVLEFDAASAHAWAQLLARLKKSGREMPIKDSLIAATALAYDLTVATRNTVDYQHAKVRVVNPFQS